jgi:hypothetical protein
MINYGLNPRMGFEPRKSGKHPAAEDFVAKMKKIHEEAQSALKKAQDDMKVYADRKRSDAPEYQVGDKVWLSTKNLNMKRPTRKLAEKQVGPYEILEIISSNAVRLKLPKSLPIHPVVNVSSVRPYRAPAFKGQKPNEPAPVEVDGQQEYEVERILDSRRHRGKLEFLVGWKGFTAEHNSWESEKDVANAKARVKQFYQENSGAARRIRHDVFDAIPWRKLECFTDGDADRKQVLFNWLDVHPEDEP